MKPFLPGLFVLGAAFAAGPCLGQYEEQQRQIQEVERLQRLGKHKEAAEAMRRLQESMPPEMRSLLQGLPVDVFEGAEEGFEMQQAMLETPESQVRPPLFVQPSQIYGSFASHMQSINRLPSEARRLWTEAMFKVQARDYGAAEQGLTRALAIVREKRGRHDPAVAQIFDGLARLERARGNAVAALAHLDSAIEIVEKAEGEASPWLAHFLWQEAALHGEAGAAPRAVAACERALKLLGRGGTQSVNYAIALNNLGVALHRQGAAERARAAYEASLAIFSRPPPRMNMLEQGQAFNPMSVLAGSADPGEMAQARQWNLAEVAANLGLLDWQAGRLQEALRQFWTAFDARAELEKAQDPFATEAGALAKAAGLAAELHAVQSLERAATDRSAPSLALQILLERKGAVLERQARGMDAFRAGLAEPLPEKPGFFSFGASAMEQKLKRERREIEQAQDREVLQEYRAAVAERSALAQQPPGTAEEQAERRRRIGELDVRVQALQQQIQMRAAQQRPDFAPPPVEMMRQGGVQAIADYYQGQQDQREQRERKQRASLLADVQARLPQGAVLLEMVKYRPLDPGLALAEDKRWGAARYGTYVIRASGTPEYVDLGEAAPVEKLVGEFRAALARQLEDRSRALGRRLDALLMQPLRGHLRDAKLVLLAPEGPLNLVPYGALVDEENRYLVERHTFSYLSSGRDLLRAEGLRPRGPAIVMADPAFGRRAAAPAAPSGQRSRGFDGLVFERLPGTVAEAQTLKQILPEAALLTGEQATETALKRLQGPRILHIATHGFFLEDAAASDAGQTPVENPMLRSGLVFAGVNALHSGEDDGVLTALEASALDLAGTKLVVLSACETGVGQVSNGEGVFGLRRALIVAGAESLLMSLWQVADEATKDLMIGYYTRLARGEGRAEALRQTQLAMLKDPKLSHPFFWASFIPSGNWTGLEEVPGKP